MKSTAMRLFLVAVLVALITWGSSMARSGLKPPQVKLPDKDFQKLPLQLAAWQGEDLALDPKVYESVGADIIVNRSYHDEAGHVVKLHVAVFSDPDTGVFHSPPNCYRAHGWTPGAEEKMLLQVGDQKTIEGDASTWDAESAHVALLYWYQLGDHILYDRFGLGGVRWALRGQEVWPALIKVLLETPTSGDPVEDKERLRDVGERIYRWINDSAAPPAAEPAAADPKPA
jgi:EpsI family protein